MTKPSSVNIKESVIQKGILQYLKHTGYSAWKVPLGPMMVRGKGRVFAAPNPLKGFPDIMGILKNYPGRMFCIEVKSKTGKLSKEQIEWRDKLQFLGVAWCLARSVKDAIEFLELVDCAVTSVLWQPTGKYTYPQKDAVVSISTNSFELLESKPDKPVYKILGPI